jgi:hypothetical protein
VFPAVFERCQNASDFRRRQCLAPANDQGIACEVKVVAGMPEIDGVTKGDGGGDDGKPAYRRGGCVKIFS